MMVCFMAGLQLEQFSPFGPTLRALRLPARCLLRFLSLTVCSGPPKSKLLNPDLFLKPSPDLHGLATPFPALVQPLPSSAQAPFSGSFQVSLWPLQTRAPAKCHPHLLEPARRLESSSAFQKPLSLSADVHQEVPGRSESVSVLHLGNSRGMPPSAESNINNPRPPPSR